MNNFFKHNDKVYSENLNDSVLVGNAFSWSISMDLPTDSDGLFPSSSDVVKAKVADVYATPNTNLSIGSTIENSSGSSQVYRLTVYPNFNRYGGFTFVSLEGDGSVIITEKGGTSPVRNNLDYANLGNVTELKTLKEYDIVVTIPSGGVVTGLSFGFKSSSADVTASINQSNVTGLESALTGLNEGLDDVETGVSDNLSKINTLSMEVWNNTSQTGTSRIDSLEDNVSSLSTSITNLGNVDTGWVTLSWASNFATHSTGQDLRVRKVGKIVQLTGWAKPTIDMTIDADNPKTIGTLPEQFRPEANLEILCQGSYMAIFLLSIKPDGTIQVSRYRFTNSTSTTYPSVSSGGAWLPFNATWIVP